MSGPLAALRPVSVAVIALISLPQIMIWPLLGMGTAELAYGNILMKVLFFWLCLGPLALFVALYFSWASIAQKNDRAMLWSWGLFTLGTMPWAICLVLGR